MADITIHGIDDRIIARLQRDADAQGISLEGMILHVLSRWEELKNTPVYVPVESKHKLPMATFEPADFAAAVRAGIAAAERGEPCPPYPTREEVEAAYGLRDGGQEGGEEQGPK